MKITCVVQEPERDFTERRCEGLGRNDKIYNTRSTLQCTAMYCKMLRY